MIKCVNVLRPPPPSNKVNNTQYHTCMSRDQPWYDPQWLTRLKTPTNYIYIIRNTLCAYIRVIHPHISPQKGSKCSPWPQLSCTERWAVWCPPSWLCRTALGCCSAGMGRHNGTHTLPHPAQPTHPVMSNKTHTYNRAQTQRCQLINPFTAIMTSDDVLNKVVSVCL